MIKKALIFNPYLDTLGGGEFYSLLVADFLLNKKFELEIAWPEKDVLEKIKQRFNLDFKNKVRVNEKAFLILKKKGNFIEKFLLTRNYGLVFFVSDGSIPLLLAQQNWLLFQSPFIKVQGRSVLNQAKLRRIDQVICYSQFVKKFIDKEFRVNSRVIYPAISNQFLKLTKPEPVKRNIILSVGRFDEVLNAKKQDILVKNFRKMVDRGLRNWQLVLLGGLMKPNKDFKKLKSLTKGYPVKIIINASFKSLVDYYQKAKIYWHGAGFGENLWLHPEKAEHFGITILEAMFYGSVPLVFKAGGPLEILGERNKALFWQKTDGLISKTNFWIRNEAKRQKKGEELRTRSKKFSQKDFYSQLSQLFHAGKN